MKPFVHIVILNWNGKKDTLECLDSVGQLDYPNYKVIVVDNGSHDDSVDAISKQYPGITLLQTGANLGFSGGNNVGIRWALEHGAHFILLLNNDTIVSKELLSAFVAAAHTLPTGSVLGAKIYFYDEPDTLWFAGGQWHAEKLAFIHRGSHEKDGADFANIHECDYITGCALFAKAAVFTQIGLLDDNFFLTYEETDWCYRARGFGYKSIVVPEAKLWHKVSVSFGGSGSPLQKYFMTRNRLLWGKRHLPEDLQRTLRAQTWQSLRAIILPPCQLAKGTAPLLKRLAWSLLTWTRDVRRNLSTPVNVAVLYALRDYYFGRLGDCPAAVRSLAAKPKPSAKT